MRPSVTRDDYAIMAEQFIHALGLVAVQQALGEGVSNRIEATALRQPIFQKALHDISAIIAVRRSGAGDGGILYTVTMPQFPASMSVADRDGFRAIYATVLARSLGLLVTEFTPDSINKAAFNVRLLDSQQQSLFEQVETIGKFAGRSR